MVPPRSHSSGLVWHLTSSKPLGSLNHLRRAGNTVIYHSLRVAWGFESCCALPLKLYETPETHQLHNFFPICTDNAMEHWKCHETSNFMCGYSTSQNIAVILDHCLAKYWKIGFKFANFIHKRLVLWAMSNWDVSSPFKAWRRKRAAAILWRFKWRVRTFAIATPNLGTWIGGSGGVEEVDWSHIPNVGQNPFYSNGPFRM